jgi:cobalt-zinc-cadmium resistance protein CzcA
MLNKIIAFSIANKLIIFLLTLALIITGLYQTTKLPIDAVPDITDNQVQIITVSPALGAPDIERFITIPIEQSVSNIPGLKQLRSFSRFGLSVITIVFTDNTDIYWARQQVGEKLKLAQEFIPKEYGLPQIAPLTTGLGEIYQYTIRAKKGYENKYSPMELRTIQDWVVRKQLLRAEGVAEVASFGGFLKQYEISIDPNKLKANNVSIKDVFSALEKNNQNTGGAYIEKGPTVLFIRSEGLINTIDDIKQISIKNLSNGIPLKISDVAEVNIGHAIRYGAMTFNGKGEVSGAVVMMLKGANSSHVIKNIKIKIAEIQKTLPEGVIIDPFLDRTKMVNNSINTVSKNLLEGALIVIFILVLFLANIRASLLVASVIPLSMLFAIIMMNIFGVSGNLMSLGALDFGLIVDGAVIIVESVLHGARKKLSGNISKEAIDIEVGKSAGRMMNSAVFGQIIILMVYLPIFTLEGIEGKMFKPMAQTVSFALIGAFILSLTYVPMMTALVLRKQRITNKTFFEKFIDKIEKYYESMLNKALSYGKIIIACVVILFCISLTILFNMGGEFIPELPEGDFAVETRVLTGSNLGTSIEAVTKAQKILLSKFPEIEKVVGKTGSSEVPTDPMPIEASDLMIILKDRKEWTSAKTYDELSEKMSKELAIIPGVTFSFQYPVAMRFNELMTGARQDVVCKIFGENLDTLAKYAQQIGAEIKQIKGTENLYIEPITGVPQIVINYDRKKISQYGLSINEINNIVNTAFAGQSAGLVYEGEKKFDLIVRSSNFNRNNINDVKNLLIPIDNGNQIQLINVADVDEILGPNQIQRENTNRRIIVGFNISKRDVESTVNELMKNVDKKIKLPTGYYLKYGGAFENLNAAKSRLGIALPLALAIIFILLFFAFNSIKQGMIIFSAIPLSAIGGILGLWIRDMPFSISAGIGFIALFGVAVLNGIVLLSEFNKLKIEGEQDVVKIVISGAKNRLRPILMTALVASFGFLPMAFSNGEGSQVQRPLATVVIGGLLLATLLTLFLIPIIYTFTEKKKISVTKLGLLLIGFLSINFASTVQAQNYISLNSALDSAVKNNLSIRAQALQIKYSREIEKNVYAIPNTNIVANYGQINSNFIDNGLSITQNLKFPTIYTKEKNVLKEETAREVINGKLQENEIKKEVYDVFFEINFLRQKKRLLEKSDSIFLNFLVKSELRQNNGETNILELNLAKNQLQQIKIQLNELASNMEILLLKFNYLINSTKNLEPENVDNKINQSPKIDSSQIAKHPFVAGIYQQQIIGQKKLVLEKNKLFPDIIAAYNNISITGNGADNIYYSKNQRFQSLQLGVGIPIFFSAQKASISASKTRLKYLENNYTATRKTFILNYQIAVNKYFNLKKSIELMEQGSLKNSYTTIKIANDKFNNGDINYLEWVILIQSSLENQNSYLETIHQLNRSIIEINALNNFN